MFPNNTAQIMGVRNYITWPKHFYKMLKARMFVYTTHKSWKCAHNLFINLASGNLQNASELHRKQLRLWTHQSWKFVQNFLCKLWRRRTSEMRLNITENSLIFGRTNRDNAPWIFFINLAERELQNAPEFHSKQLRFLTQKSWNCAHNLFVKPAGRELSEFHGKQLRSWTKKSWNCAHNLFFKLGGRELPECVWTSQQTALFLDEKIVELRPQLFL